MTGPVTEIGELREACAEAARRGGAVLREKWGTHRTIDYKGGIDLVTDADRASEEEVLGFLTRRFPGSAVLAEESGARSAVRGAAGAELRWFVDPLDGTTNYAHGVPHFAVNVAVSDGAGLAAGATFEPLRGEMYLAGRGEGAWLGEQRLAVSRTEDLGRALLCTGFPVRHPAGSRSTAPVVQGVPPAVAGGAEVRCRRARPGLRGERAVRRVLGGAAQAVGRGAGDPAGPGGGGPGRRLHGG